MFDRIYASAYPNKDESGAIISLLGVHTDITSIKQMQERIRQSEKMEAIGQLAGGIAHDFNNQLGGIMGLAELLLDRVRDPILQGYVSKIITTASHAADLTGQLLAFARKGQYQYVMVNVHELIRDVVDILRHSIDKKIEISQGLNATMPIVKGDPNQLQNALLNLSLNARDAMLLGGELRFSTATMQVDEAFCTKEMYDLAPGHYLKLGVTDTGCGIPKENIQRIFEPFFTTKEVGKGTGMGLASVYGTVKQHNGLITVQSEIGHGTAFTIYLPAIQESGTVKSPNEQKAPVAQNTRILLVDDEEMIRNTATEALTNSGCCVTSFAQGEPAMEFFQQHWKEVDLVILDLVLPKMSGSEIYYAMKAINPQVRVLLASGYSVNGVAQELLSAGANGFIQKPFRLAPLLLKIQEALNCRPSNNSKGSV